MFWQYTITALVILAAVAFLILQAVRSARGCGGCHCARKKPDEAATTSNVTIIPVQDLRLRQRKTSTDTFLPRS